MSDRESGLSARTIAGRLWSVLGVFCCVLVRGGTGLRCSPVPRGLATRRRGGRSEWVPGVRVPRTLPKLLSPADVHQLVGALRTHRDGAMVLAMLLAGLRR